MGNFMDHEPTEAALQVHMTFGGCPPGPGTGYSVHEQMLLSRYWGCPLGTVVFLQAQRVYSSSEAAFKVTGHYALYTATVQRLPLIKFNEFKV